MFVPDKLKKRSILILIFCPSAGLIFSHIAGGFVLSIIYLGLMITVAIIGGAFLSVEKEERRRRSILKCLLLGCVIALILAFGFAFFFPKEAFFVFD